MSKTADTLVPCSTRTRDKLRGAKRGGDTYEDLFQKMLEQYDPEEAYEGNY